MQYLTTYYWQQEEKPLTSLVLQQLANRKRNVPVLFACLCSVEEGEWGNSYFAERLSSWFQSKGRALLMKNKDNEEKIIAQLQDTIGQIDEELAENKLHRHSFFQRAVSVAGILCRADYYLLFYRGSIKVYLLNERFGQANCRKVTEGNCEELQIVTGTMEKKIGLLLAAKDFGKGLSETQIRECLAVKTLTGKASSRRSLKDVRTDTRHLQELGQVSAQNGGRHMGAVMLVTQ